MRMGSLLRARLAVSFRDPFSLFFIILAIIVSVSAAVMSQEKTEASLKVAVVCEDAGDLGEKLIAILQDTESFRSEEMVRKDAMRRLKQDRLGAVIVITSVFSDEISRGEFRNTLELYTSPSSVASSTISEPLINGVLMLWVEEYSTIITDNYLTGHGITYDGTDEDAQREKIEELWDNGSILSITNTILEQEEDPAEAAGPFVSFVRWYGVLCLFYLVAGASWVLDMGKKSIRERARQTGTKQWLVIVTTSTAPLIICLMGYVIAGAAACFLTDVHVVNVAALFIPMLLYLCSLIGVTLLLASVLRNILSMMFLAPVVTFLFGVLSGLMMALPDWAYVLKWISQVLPGRWLNESLAEPLSYVPLALLCCAGWLALGIAASALRSKRKKI